MKGTVKIWMLFTLCFLTACSALNPIRLYLESQLPEPDSASEVRFSEEMVPVRTGERLYTSIFSPAGGPHPCLLVRLPLPRSLSYSLFREAFGEVWASHGYQVVIQNVRGFPPSEGEFYPFLHERSDGEDTLRWLKAKGLCQEPIYSWGGSYFGLTQWAVADLIQGPKVIQISSPRLKDVFFPGGAFALSTALFWTARNDNLSPSIQALRDAAAAGPDTADERLTGRPASYYRSWLQSEGDDVYWDSVFPHAETVEGPVLLMGGWFDPFLPQMLEDFASLRARPAPTKLIIGPWGHAVTIRTADGHLDRNYRLESIERPMRWFEGLRNRDEDKTIELFLMGEDRWVTLDHYPPEKVAEWVWQLDLSARELYLKGEGEGRAPNATVRLELDSRNPTPGAGGIELGDDIGPRSQEEIEARSDVFTALSEPFPQSVAFIGVPRLTAAAQYADCRPDLIITLVDVFPNGVPYLFTEGVHRFAGFETSVPVVLRPTAYTIRAGHRLGIQIAPANFPKYNLPVCASKAGHATLVLDNGPESAWILRMPKVDTPLKTKVRDR